MLLNKNTYKDNLSKIIYNLNTDIQDTDKSIILIQGENGVGKTRFVEGVLLKELKKNNKKLLYFGQDLENQILSFNLISLVKDFVDNLRKQGSFFKTIFLNDDSHESININFNEKSTLYPDNESKRDFITIECKKYKNLDVVIFDEVDKYFTSGGDFLSFIYTISSKHIFIISHLIPGEFSRLNLVKNSGEVQIEFFNS